MDKDISVTLKVWRQPETLNHDQFCFLTKFFH